MKPQTAWFSRLTDSRLAIGFILVVATILRGMGIATREIQYDDAFSILLSEQSFTKIASGAAADTMPPLYFWLLHVWMQISHQIWFLRALTVLLNLLTVYIFYRLAALLFDRRSAFWAALIAAVVPIQLYHAQDIRMYALLLLAQTCYAYCFVRVWRSAEQGLPNRWNWAGLILAGGVAMYSHNIAIFGLIAPDLFLLLRKKWKLLGQLIAAQLGIGLLAIPWLIQIPAQFAKVQRAWSLSRPGILELVQAIIQFTGALPLPTVLTVIVAVLSLWAFCLVTLETIRAVRRNEAVLLAACFAVLSPVLLFIASYIMQPIFIPRAFLLSGLMYYALVGWLIARSWPRGASILVAGAFLLAAGLSLPSFYAFNQFPRSPFAQSVRYLETVIQPGDVIVHDNKLSYFPAELYSRTLPQGFLADEPGSPNDTLSPVSAQVMGTFPVASLESAIAGKQRVYYVVFERTIQEYQSLGAADHPNLTWLADHYSQVDRRQFGDLDVYSFEN
ncbi:MAG TPA: glycosyltransferase family 39 protein [Anaerolineaceae bacterium]|nr:glycosyltransferase family 39 protein [Anaerolineaceae bacterium]